MAETLTARGVVHVGGLVQVKGRALEGQAGLGKVPAELMRVLKGRGGRLRNGKAWTV